MAGCTGGSSWLEGCSATPVLEWSGETPTAVSRGSWGGDSSFVSVEGSVGVGGFAGVIEGEGGVSVVSSVLRDSAELGLGWDFVDLGGGSDEASLLVCSFRLSWGGVEER